MPQQAQPQLIIKTYQELTKDELYDILQVRTAVFVVEQNCPYQELDGIDRICHHAFFRQDGQITAYLRFFPRAGEPGTVQIGRVLTTHRGQGLGGALLHQALAAIRGQLDPERIYLESQCYAAGFYARQGFTECTDTMIEDGIPHVGMQLYLKDNTQEKQE